jgi:hypothetical protein
MTLQTNFFQTTVSPLVNARDERRRNRALAKAPGYVLANDFKVVAVAGSLAVDVTACAEGGGLWWQPGRFAHRGMYFAYLDATERVTLNPAHATLARTDLIVLTMHDGEYEGDATFTTAVDKVTGTAGGGVPATPNDAYVLAQVAVPAAATAVGTITDRRTRSEPAPSLKRFTATRSGAGQNMSGGAAAINWTSVEAGWSTTPPTTQVTVPAGADGTYIGTVTVNYAAGVNSATRVIVQLLINSVVFDEVVLPPVNSAVTATKVQLFITRDLAAGDVLNIYSNHNASGGVAVNAWWYMFRIN